MEILLPPRPLTPLYDIAFEHLHECATRATLHDQQVPIHELENSLCAHLSTIGGTDEVRAVRSRITAIVIAWAVASGHALTPSEPVLP